MTTGRLMPPNLDDRTWTGIVDDAKKLIPTYCPEWTDHNPSDLGITLIELFAWIAESIIYRLNQVPEKNYITFLNLLGITRDPPQPASVTLSFTGVANTKIPQGTRVATKQTEQEDAVEFETDIEITLDVTGKGEVEAKTALTVHDEKLGTSTGEPFQVFTVRQIPIYEDGALEISVAGDKSWKRVEEFAEGNGKEYRCNPVTGEIYFGNYNSSTTDNPGRGRIPDQGATITAAYRFVKVGSRGNVPANTIIVIKSTVPGVTVDNPQAASAGADWEPIEETLQRAPDLLKVRDRAVTTSDYEYLAREAGTNLAKAKCFPPKLKIDGSPETLPFSDGVAKRAPGTVHMSIVPNNTDDVQPVCTKKEKEDLKHFLDERRTLTSQLFIHDPIWAEIKVEVVVVVPSGTIKKNGAKDPRESIIEEALRKFFQPVSGHLDGQGWEFGEDVFWHHVYELIYQTQGISYIKSLGLKKDSGPVRPSGWLAVEEYELVCSAPNHIVKVEEENQPSGSP